MFRILLVQIMIPRKTHLTTCHWLLIFMFLGVPHALLMYRVARINSYATRCPLGLVRMYMIHKRGNIYRELVQIMVPRKMPEVVCSGGYLLRFSYITPWLAHTPCYCTMNRKQILDGILPTHHPHK